MVIHSTAERSMSPAKEACCSSIAWRLSIIEVCLSIIEVSEMQRAIKIIYQRVESIFRASAKHASPRRANSALHRSPLKNAGTRGARCGSMTFARTWSTQRARSPNLPTLAVVAPGYELSALIRIPRFAATDSSAAGHRIMHSYWASSISTRASGRHRNGKSESDGSDPDFSVFPQDLDWIDVECPATRHPRRGDRQDPDERECRRVSDAVSR
jgi:hypothetical protein